MEKRESRLSDLSEEKLAHLHDLEVSVEERLHEFKAVKDSLERVTEDTTRVSRELDQLQQYSRRNNIRILGIKESPNENTDQLVCQIARSIGVDLAPTDLDRSHRVSRRPQEGPIQDPQGNRSFANATRSSDSRPRAIIAKMMSYKSKEALIRNRRKLKG